jgi:hypothetical protein
MKSHKISPFAAVLCRILVTASAKGAQFVSACERFPPHERKWLMAVIDSTEKSIRVRQ